MPEDIPAIPLIPVIRWTIPTERLINLLMDSIPSSEWDGEFVDLVKKDRLFFESGLDMIGSIAVCPFCGQKLDESALRLIASYREFFSGKEAALFAEIKRMVESIENILTEINELQDIFRKRNMQYSVIQQYLPSLYGTKLNKPEIEENELLILRSLLGEVKEKFANLEYTYTEIKELEALCRFIIQKLNEKIERINELFEYANQLKDNINKERLTLRKRLCVAQYSRCHDKLESVILKREKLKKKIEEAREDIRLKELATKRDRKEAVYKTLVYCLNQFFNGKYLLDKSTFRIVFQTNVLEAGASHVLSDGEKSIVAFCYYVALTHTLVNSEQDYGRLFFIIDDPVSSMDYKYVFVLAQILRNLNGIFDIENSFRVWILTHSCEFFNLIARNHVLGNSCSYYYFKPGIITRFKKGLMLPYECHLNDILEVAHGKEPNHTIANSIRHVLETINKFENPTRKLESFIQENELLASDACIYIMCNDLSHGNIGLQPSISKDDLIRACIIVVQFMQAHYPGQIGSIVVEENQA